MKQSKQVVLLVFFAVCVFLQANDACASSVQDQLKTTIDKIMDILRDPSLKGDLHTQERRKALRSTVNQRFSFEKMSQLSLARHWKQRNDEEKKAFIQMFGQLLENTYISKIEAYTNEKVEYVKEYVNGNKAQINTKIITETVEIPIDYRMYQEKDGTWMIYDLVIEGVSLVGNYRSQFDQILQKDPYEKLVEDLKKKIES